MSSKLPFTSVISSKMGFSSVRLCFEDMLKTITKAWPEMKIIHLFVKLCFSPLTTESLLMAGNWWLPVVSVTSRVTFPWVPLINFLGQGERGLAGAMGYTKTVGSLKETLTKIITIFMKCSKKGEGRVEPPKLRNLQTVLNPQL